MTDDEVTAFLDEHRTVQIATLGADGWPHLTTLWYGMVDGELAVWTYRKSQKVRNLERDPRLTALVESGGLYAELRGVMLRGRARMSDHPDVVMQVAQAVYERNAGRFGDVEFKGGTLDQTRVDALQVMSAKRMAVFVEPDEVVTWDHRKLGGLY